MIESLIKLYPTYNFIKIVKNIVQQDMGIHHEIENPFKTKNFLVTMLHQQPFLYLQKQLFFHHF